MNDNARQAALDVLNAVDKGGRHLDAIMEQEVNGAGLAFSMRDRRLVNALVYGVLRWRRRLDRIIEKYSSIPLKKIQPQVLNILRLGLFQLFFLDRIPVSAAVNTSVEMAKKIVSPRVAGFINGLLRTAARNPAAVTGLIKADDSIPSMAVAWSFPEWLIRRWVARYGTLETGALCDAINTIPPITVRTNTMRTDRNGLINRLVPETGDVRKTRYAPDGLLFSSPQKPIHELTAFRAGLFQVQDEAAQLISFMLSPRPGERVLDACAGLGGKTGHLAQLMGNRGHIVATDRDGKKLKRLDDEMKRLGLGIVEAVASDLEDMNSTDHLGRFDRILLDAPCSGLGVIRRNPDIKWDDSRRNLDRFAKKQAGLLENAALMLKPGGMLVYAVCSLEPEENEKVVFPFLKNHTNFEIVKGRKDLLFDITPFLDKKGFFRAVPHIHETDGFFAACLKRLK